MVFLSKNWLWILAIGVAIFLIIQGDKDIRALKKENRQLKSEIKQYQELVEKNLELIDALSIKDTVYVDRIKTIKAKADVQVKYVDTMSVSDMQDFFSDRYPDQE